jgi:hypothetical protein
MMPPPGPPITRDGMSAVNDQTGETVVLFRRHTRRKEIAEWLQALLEKPPHETVAGAWGQAHTQEDADVEAVGRGAAGRLVWRYLPPDSPWLNPLARRWRHFRREVTHGELCERVKALLAAAQAFFARHNQAPQRVLSSIGAIPKNLSVCT